MIEAPMSREYAHLYALALVVGAGEHGTFDVSFSNSLDTALVANALREMGCSLEWDPFGKCYRATVPGSRNRHVA